MTSVATDELPGSVCVDVAENNSQRSLSNGQRSDAHVDDAETRLLRRVRWLRSGEELHTAHQFKAVRLPHDSIDHDQVFV